MDSGGSVVELLSEPCQALLPISQPQHPTSFWQQPAPQSHPMTHGPTSRALLLLPEKLLLCLQNPGTIPLIQEVSLLTHHPPEV